MCDKETKRKYHREYMREYNHRPYVKQYRKENTKKYRERVGSAKIKRDKYTQDLEHKERLLEQNRLWKKDNAEKVASINNNRYARLKEMPGSLSYLEILNIFEEQGGKCPGCLQLFSEYLPYTIDHFVPVNKGGTNYSDNIQLLCKSCNCSKRASLWSDWIILKEAA